MKLNKFQTQTFDGWKGLTKSNHLSALYGSNKQATDIFLRINDYNHGMSLESQLSKFPTKYYEDDEEITWKLSLSARRNIPLIEARDFNGNVVEADTMVGVNTEPFYLVFPEDYFADGNVIVGERNEEYPLRVLGDPKLEGTHYVYMVELMRGIVSGMPGEELQYGKKFSDDFSPVEKELSRKVGDVRFSSSIAMRNEFSRIRLQHKVAGSMLNKKVAIGIPMRDVKTNKEIVSKYWMHYEEMVVEEQFMSDKNYCIAYGTSNRTINGEYRNYGKSGNVLQTGAGIREQMSYGNTQFFTHFSIALIDDIVLNLGTLQGGSNMSANKELVIDTGVRGALLFHRAVADVASGWKMFGVGNNNANFIEKVKSDLHPNAYSAGFQFVKYMAPMGYTITLNINPMKDDPVRNKILHPLGGVAESYRFDIYSLGTMSEPNIVIARIKGTEDIRGIQRGLRDPWTGVAGGEMAYDEDSAVIHRYAEIGAIVYNPKDCVSLIPSILA